VCLFSFPPLIRPPLDFVPLSLWIVGNFLPRTLDFLFVATPRAPNFFHAPFLSPLSHQWTFLASELLMQFSILFFSLVSGFFSPVTPPSPLFSFRPFLFGGLPPLGTFFLFCSPFSQFFFFVVDFSTTPRWAAPCHLFSNAALLRSFSFLVRGGSSLIVHFRFPPSFCFFFFLECFLFPPVW